MILYETYVAEDVHAGFSDPKRLTTAFSLFQKPKPSPCQMIESASPVLANVQMRSDQYPGQPGPTLISLESWSGSVLVSYDQLSAAKLPRNKDKAQAKVHTQGMSWHRYSWLYSRVGFVADLSALQLVGMLAVR